MNFLELIWLASLLLSGGAIAVMLGLIFVRVLIMRRARLREIERRRLAPILIGQEQVDPAVLRHVNPEVAAELTLELIDMVRGEERTAFLEKANALGIPQRLMRSLRSSSRRTRTRAAQGLAKFDQPDTRAALFRALRDPSREVRLIAALALTGSSEPPTASELIDQLRLGTKQPSLVAVTLFRHIAAARPEEIRAIVLDGRRSTRVRLAALEALATTGDYSLVPVIAGLALEADAASEDLPRYLHALGKLGHPAAGPTVLRCLASPTMAARAAAAGAAGRIMLVESADRLVELLDDEEWWVRFRSAESLTLLGDPGLERLRRAARTGTERARAAAATVLAEQGLAA